MLNIYPAGNYTFKVNNKNTRTRCEICSKLTIKRPERCQWRRSGILIVNFEHVIAGWKDNNKHSRTAYINVEWV